MNSTDKKLLIKCLQDIRTDKKLTDLHINYLLQKIHDANLTAKIIKEVKK